MHSPLHECLLLARAFLVVCSWWFATLLRCSRCLVKCGLPSLVPIIKIWQSSRVFGAWAYSAVIQPSPQFSARASTAPVLEAVVNRKAGDWFLTHQSPVVPSVWARRQAHSCTEAVLLSIGPAYVAHAVATRWTFLIAQQPVTMRVIWRTCVGICRQDRKSKESERRHHGSKQD